MMDEARFWKIVDESRELARRQQRKPVEDFIDLHEKALASLLRQMKPEEVISFDERFWDRHRFAYRWNLWAAAYWLHGGCGDDGFIDFRSCLISLGKQRFYQVLEDPDSLADLVDQPDMPYMQAEGFQYVASKVYRQKTGKDMPQQTWCDTAPLEPIGERIDHDDEDVMREHFPKLVAKFPEMGD